MHLCYTRQLNNFNKPILYTNTILDADQRDRALWNVKNVTNSTISIYSGARDWLLVLSSDSRPRGIAFARGWIVYMLLSYRSFFSTVWLSLVYD